MIKLLNSSNEIYSPTTLNKVLLLIECDKMNCINHCGNNNKYIVQTSKCKKILLIRVK